VVEDLIKALSSAREREYMISACDMESEGQNYAVSGTFLNFIILDLVGARETKECLK
jgi:hypothetical protein